MDGKNPVDTFVWLLRMTITDLAPVYLALLAMPLVAFRFQGTPGLARAIAAIAVAHVGPLLVLAMGAWLFGQAQSHSYLSYIQLAIAAAGIWLVVRFTKPLREVVPRWAFILFFFGVGVIALMALFVGGMALVNDWI